MRITVCTLAYNDWYREIVKYSIENMRNYCKNHGYEFFCDIEDKFDREPPWYKILLIKKLLSDCDYCVWIDADTQILKMEVKLEYFIEKYLGKKDVLVGTQLGNVLNTGVMFFRNCNDNIKLLDLIWNNDSSNFDIHFHEQSSFSNIYTRNLQEYQNRIVILGPNLQNEFLSYWFMYYPNSCFIMHAARCAHDREGFIFTMDLFCPIKMIEENEEQYLSRLEWMKDEKKCRKTIDSWISGINPKKRIGSARNKKDFV